MAVGRDFGNGVTFLQGLAEKMQERFLASTLTFNPDDETLPDHPRPSFILNSYVYEHPPYG
jgi:hypothetical protein